MNPMSWLLSGKFTVKENSNAKGLPKEPLFIGKKWGGGKNFKLSSCKKFVFMKMTTVLQIVCFVRPNKVTLIFESTGTLHHTLLPKIPEQKTSSLVVYVKTLNFISVIEEKIREP